MSVILLKFKTRPKCSNLCDSKIKFGNSCQETIIHWLALSCAITDSQKRSDSGQFGLLSLTWIDNSTVNKTVALQPPHS